IRRSTPHCTSGATASCDRRRGRTSRGSAHTAARRCDTSHPPWGRVSYRGFPPRRNLSLVRRSTHKRSAQSIAAVLALAATIAFVPLCSPPLPCCRAEITAAVDACCARHVMKLAPERAPPPQPMVLAEAPSVVILMHVSPAPLRAVPFAGL